MFFLRRRQHRNIYYLHPRPWYRRPRRPAVPRVVRRNVLLNKISLVIGRWFSNFLYRAVAAVAVLLGLTFVVISSTLSIQGIEVVRGNFNINSAKVEDVLRGYSGKSIILTRKKRIAESIIGNFPEFKTVTVKKILPDRIQISLEAYPFVANLKAYYIKESGPQPSSYQFSELNRVIQELARNEGEQMPLSAIENNNDSATDEDKTPPTTEEASVPPALPARSSESFERGGGSATEAPIEQKGLVNAIGQAIFDQEEDLELKTIVIRDLGRPILDREQVIPETHIQYILDSIDYFEKNMDLKVNGVTYFQIGHEIHLKTKNNFSVWMTLEQPFTDQIDKLKVIYERAELNKIDLAYIDCRIKEKVIYCPRQSPCRSLAND